MAALALASPRFVPITLGAQRTPLDLARILQSPPATVRHIACRAATPAQRSVTAALIDGAVAEADRAVILIAEGVGCAAAAWWARLSPRSYVDRVAGALLIDPDGAPSVAGAFASPRVALPFPSLVLGTGDVATRLSGEWGSRLLAAPAPTLSAPRSGRLMRMVQRFTTAIVEKDVGKAERLLEAVGER